MRYAIGEITSRGVESMISLAEGNQKKHQWLKLKGELKGMWKWRRHCGVILISG
ncbi:MAG: hypothetical protein PHX16_07885 [Syntrophaceticus sp.]|nr:hypothetical protein [Syntrophaceticus sp.]MDD3314499.1 hypothetical protein [Syntrophaceticus sp.]MDD4783531.1 hypothetical protein [Syntrophaceticus sp.]